MHVSDSHFSLYWRTLGMNVLAINVIATVTNYNYCTVLGEECSFQNVLCDVTKTVLQAGRAEKELTPATLTIWMKVRESDLCIRDFVKIPGFHQNSRISTFFQDINNFPGFRQLSRISSSTCYFTRYFPGFRHFSRISTKFQDIVIFPGYRHFSTIST